MAALVGERFACGWERRGTLQVYVSTEPAPTVLKAGGNVALYVCRPDGRVLHVIPGAPAPEVLLRELRWALELDAALRSVPWGAPALVAAGAHAQRQQEGGAHWLLQQQPLPPVREVEARVFRDLLGEVHDPTAPTTVYQVPLEQLIFVNFRG